MQRLQTACLAVIATVLVADLALAHFPEAHAASDRPVQCFATAIPGVGLTADPTKQAEKIATEYDPVRAWLDQHPGDTVYTAAVATSPISVVEYVCVR